MARKDFAYVQLPAKEEYEDFETDHGVRHRSKPVYGLLLGVLLAGSILGNILQYTLSASPQPEVPGFAGLSYNITRNVTWYNEFYSKSTSEDDESWRSIDLSPGIVALPETYAKEKGLPLEADLFPWDTSKRIYVLEAYHSLHCLMKAREAFQSSLKGEPQPLPLEHTLHCFDRLRQYIVCHADDTPVINGEGDIPPQARQCRDFDALLNWGRSHTACWRFIHSNNRTVDTLERYKYCPPDSPYVDQVVAYFGANHWDDDPMQDY